MPRSQSSCREVSGPGGVNASSLILAAARESTDVSSGSDYSEKALTVILRSPRALTDGSLLVAEKPARVVTEGGPPIPVRRERHDHSAAMVTCSVRALKSSTDAASARWIPRH